MLKNFLQKVFNFNFGQQEKEYKHNAAASQKAESALQKKSEAVAECFSLLREAEEQKKRNLSSDALLTLEKIIEIMEKERF